MEGFAAEYGKMAAELSQEQRWTLMLMLAGDMSEKTAQYNAKEIVAAETWLEAAAKGVETPLWSGSALVDRVTECGLFLCKLGVIAGVLIERAEGEKVVMAHGVAMQMAERINLLLVACCDEAFRAGRTVEAGGTLPPGKPEEAETAGLFEEIARRHQAEE